MGQRDRQPLGGSVAPCLLLGCDFPFHRDVSPPKGLSTYMALGTHSVIRRLLTLRSQLCEEKVPFTKDWWEMAFVQRSGSHSLCPVLSLDIFGGTVSIYFSIRKEK